MEPRFNWKTERKLKEFYEQWRPGLLEKFNVSRKELESLIKGLVGRVVLRGEDSYEASRMSHAHTSLEEYPEIILYCETINDVWISLEWATIHKFSVTCRSGGHSTANYSLNNGLVIDVSGLSYVVINPEAMQAYVGAGTQFDKLNSTLETYNVHMPTGGCPTVAVAGYMMGGGYGFTSREFGMLCDSLVSIKMMLYNGKIIEANNCKNRDLYWAVRGGTGNNFGILLETTFQLYHLNELWGFVLSWPIEDAPDVLIALQQHYMKTGASSRLGHQLVLTHKVENRQPTSPILAMAGMYNGTREEGIAQVDELLKIGSVKIEQDEISTYNKLNDGLMSFMPGYPPFKPFYEEKDGGYISRIIDRNGWQEIVNMYLKTPNKYNIAYLEIYGGAINNFPTGHNAFIHRNCYSTFCIDSFWARDHAFTDEVTAKQWLIEFMSGLESYLDGHKYQNYPKRNFPDYRWAYWGDVYNSLLFVKQKYDPKIFFQFEQGISAYPDNGQITRSNVPSIFSDPEIVYEAYSRGF